MQSVVQNHNQPKAQAEYKQPALIDTLEGLKLFSTPPSPSELSKENFSPAVSPASFAFGKIEKLLEAISDTQLNIGKTALTRHFTNPATTLKGIEEKREAIMAYRNNPALREKVDSLLTFLNKERLTYYTAFEELASVFRKDSIGKTRTPSLWRSVALRMNELLRVVPEVGRGRKHIVKLLKELNSLPEEQSAYWAKLRERAKNLISSPDYIVAKGSYHVTLNGLVTRDKLKFLTPHMSVNFGAIDKFLLVTTLTPIIASIINLSANASVIQDKETFAELMPYASMTAFTMTGFIPALGIIRTLREKQAERFKDLANASALREVFDLIGELDAISTLAKFTERAEKLGWQYPTIKEDSAYHFFAESLGNPCLELDPSKKSKRNPVEILASSPLVVTGPNSGGKTTYAITIFQSQLMAQLGLPIPAERCSMSVADRLIYQGPVYAGLDDEGRLGNEFKGIKATLDEATDRSLILLDEIAGGTAIKEQLDISEAAIKGLARLGSGTILITHDRVLAKRLQRTANATMKRFSLNNDQPTFQLYDGVATESHAMRVAEKIGLTPRQIEKLIDAKLGLD